MKEPAANIEPAFISKGAASYIASTYNAGHAAGPAPELSLDDVCLETCNSFLDYLLAMIIRDARSTSLQTLKGSLARVLDSALGYVALNEAQAELETYRNQENGQGRQFPTEDASDAKNPAHFDVEGVWSQARIRCMIYSTIGEKEEADFPVIEDDESSVTPPVAIFLTAVLEFLGEHILVTAARFARNRLGPSTSGKLTSNDLDRGIRLDKVLGSIWQGYLQLLPNPELLTSPPSREKEVKQTASPTRPAASSSRALSPPPHMSSLSAIPEKDAISAVSSTGKQSTVVAPPLAYDTAPRKSDASVYSAVTRDISPGLWSSRANSTSAQGTGSPTAEIQKATMWSKQEHVAAAQLRGLDEVRQTPPTTPLQTHESDIFASSAKREANAKLESPQTGSGVVTPRKGVTFGVQSPKIGIVEKFGNVAQEKSMQEFSGRTQGLGLSMPSQTEPDSDYGRFMQSEKLRLGDSRDAQDIEAQRMRVIAMREATIAEQQAARPKTTPRANMSPPSDLFVEAKPRQSVSLEPREARGGASNTTRLAVFLRNTGPDDVTVKTNVPAALKTETLTRSPIRQPLEEETDDEDAALFEGVTTTKRTKGGVNPRESLAEFLQSVPPPINNGAALPDPVLVDTKVKGPVILGKPMEDDGLIAGPAYANLPAGTGKVEVGTTASEANAAELARKEQLEQETAPSNNRRSSGLLKMLSPTTPDRSGSRMAVTSPRSPTTPVSGKRRTLPLVSPFMPASSFKSALSDRGDDDEDTGDAEEDEYYDDDSLYGLPRRKQPQLESLADFLRNAPPPGATTPPAAEASPQARRKSSVAQRITSLLGSNKKQDSPAQAKEDRSVSPTTPSRPNHRPLITGNAAPQL